MSEKESNSKNRRKTSSAKKSVQPARPASRQTVREPMSSDEKRQANRIKRKKIQRRNRIIGYAVAFSLVIVVAVVLALTVFFKVETFSVTGDEIYNSEQIITSSGLEVGDNMYLFNKKKVAKTIEENLPYIGRADIKRSPTGTVSIRVIAARATLALDMGDSFCLLDSQGKVLEDGVMVVNDDVAVISASSVLSSAPGFYVEFEKKEDFESIVNIRKLIDDNQIWGINAIDITDTSNVKLSYNQRIELELGMITSIEKKIEFIKATLKKIDNDNPGFIGVIDFTVENKAYLNSHNDDLAGLTTIPETTTIVDTHV